MEAMLCVSDVAELTGKTSRHIREVAKKGSLSAQVERNERNLPKYVFRLSTLPADIQTRYFEKCKAAAQNGAPIKKSNGAALEEFSESERGEISFWISTIERWQAFRNKPSGKNKAEIDEHFVALMKCEAPDVACSIDILYRKWAFVKSGDMAGLIDKRGYHRKGKIDTPADILQQFQNFYLNEAQHSIERCIEYTRLYLQEYKPDLVAKMPCYSTFWRHIKTIPYPVLILGRYGEKAYYDMVSPHIRRDYESIASNEWWVADTHTFDIISRGKDGKTHRIYINAYMDARSGIFTGWYVTANPSSEATLLALRKAILDYGIPYNIYVDNGREYLTYDIGGLGHRAKKTTANGEEKFMPPGVFERLGISMTNAIVRNARAKIIERRFRDVKEHISRLFITYTGGTVVEKPDRLKGIMHKDKYTAIECSKVVSDADLVQIVETLIKGYMNTQKYNGSVTEDKGLSRMEVYWKHYNDKPQRRAEERDLNLMLMRSTRPQKIGRNGVHLDIAGRRIDYMNDEIRNLFNKQVYLRYDPENIDTVRVYDLEDRFIMEVERSKALRMGYNATTDEVKTGMGVIRHAKRIDKEHTRLASLPIADEKTAFELVMAYAQKNLEDMPEPVSAKAIELVRVQEEPLLKAVGCTADMERMVKNAKKRNGGNFDE